MLDQASRDEQRRIDAENAERFRQEERGQSCDEAEGELNQRRLGSAARGDCAPLAAVLEEPWPRMRGLFLRVPPPKKVAQCYTRGVPQSVSTASSVPFGKVTQ